MASNRKIQVDSVPSSWALNEWEQRAPGAYPHSAPRARYIFRCHRDELIACGAIVRIGRELVVCGAAYCSWLQRNGSRVADFSIAPNTLRRAA